VNDAVAEADDGANNVNRTTNRIDWSMATLSRR
jgi:hypothetical protein